MGAMADWLGRIPVLLVSVLSVLVFGLAVAFSVDMAMFSTLRFFEGFCLAAIRLSLYVLRIELCLPAWRFSMTMIASLIIVSGQLLMPGLAALCRDWQILQIVIIAPFVLMLPYVWMFPESLRWLLVTQHYQRAKRQMFRIARSNSVDTATDSSGILSELETELQQKPKTFCVTQLSGTRNLWKNTVVLCVNSLTGYGIHHCFARSVLEGSASHLHYYALAAIAVASCMVLFPVVAGFGRRGGLLTFMIITALASLLQLGLLNLIGKYSLWHDAAGLAEPALLVRVLHHRDVLVSCRQHTQHLLLRRDHADGHQGWRSGSGPSERRFRYANSAADGAPQSEGFLPASRDPHLLHSALHHLHTVAPGNRQPTAARDYC
ncbi:solute carrier family 22 member 23-like isoform X1 [Sinocyclocheilus anshuiensis]|uniref:solute carrier family 22 member 23-like isoform X1 n=1 Tax=Sinocyclocheilus anshuiensis TaxID=1608454 RepID=UPI0007B84EA7|nr:PREDICTED: solute carrier family 22 member 23-like isoform X1 [Sinocyclocheilus anshuiensis]